MRAVNLKITAGGRLALAHPHAKPGAGIYSIHSVPHDVQPAAVAAQVNRVALAHAYDDPAGWVYDWADLRGLQQGALINRYRCA